MNKRLSLIASILILVLVGVGIFASVYFHKRAEKSESQQQQPVAKDLTLSAPEYAASGKLVESFPNSLVLDNSSAINKSLDFTYNKSKQSTAMLYGKESPKNVYAQYKKYLIDNHYKIINDISIVKTDSYALYGTSSSVDISVSIQPQDKGSQITISYIKK